MCLQYAYILRDLQLEDHINVCAMVCLALYDEDAIPLNNYSQRELSGIDYAKSNDNVVDPLTRWLNRESCKIIERDGP